MQMESGFRHLSALAKKKRTFDLNLAARIAAQNANAFCFPFAFPVSVGHFEEKRPGKRPKRRDVTSRPLNTERQHTRARVPYAFQSPAAPPPPHCHHRTTTTHALLPHHHAHLRCFRAKQRQGRALFETIAQCRKFCMTKMGIPHHHHRQQRALRGKPNQTKNDEDTESPSFRSLPAPPGACLAPAASASGERARLAVDGRARCSTPTRPPRRPTSRRPSPRAHTARRWCRRTPSASACRAAGGWSARARASLPSPP